MIELKGITWDHIRGINPLLAVSKEMENSGVKITWDARSLEDFEDYPLEKLAQNYDLIMLDHPFMGTGSELQVIEPLDSLIGKDFLMEMENNSVGGSFESYLWDGRHWALPVDAASQVSAYRKDLFDNLGIDRPPYSLIEVEDLINELPTNYKIGIPLNPTHSYCTFTSLCVNIGGEKVYKEGVGFEEEIGIAAINYIKRWKSSAHVSSIDSNPIHMLDHMSSTDEILYIPFIFGYSNYARKNSEGKIVTFTNIPSYKKNPSGSILGGVGIALSSLSIHKEEAIKFMKHVASGSAQSGTYIENDGQPAHRAAWLQEKSNDLTNDFFTSTLQTIDQSYIRPRYYGYVEFQKQAGELIHNYLNTNGENDKALMQELNNLHRASIKTKV